MSERVQSAWLMCKAAWLLEMVQTAMLFAQFVQFLLKFSDPWLDNSTSLLAGPSVLHYFESL